MKKYKKFQVIEDLKFSNSKTKYIRKDQKIKRKLLLEQAILSLSPIEYEVINQFYWYGRLINEIADNLNITENRANKIHERSLKKLKYKIEKEEKFDNNIIKIIKFLKFD